MVTEEYFPRGKTKHEEIISTDQHEKFKQKKDKSFVNIFADKDVKVKKTKSKGKGSGGKKANTAVVVKSVPSFKYPDLREGMILTGIVCDISDYELRVSLPFHLVGTLPITNISKGYSDALRKCAEDEESESDEVPPLSDLFEIGQMLVVSVVSCELERSKYNLTLSIDPARVMAGRVPNEGDLCVASVTSQEDHGYIMDVGCTTTRGFLPQGAAKKHWKKTFPPGMVYICSVSTKDKGAVKLKCEAGKVFKTARAVQNLHNVLPGTLLKSKVVSRLDNGLMLSLGSGMTAYLHRELFPTPDTKIDDFEINTELDVRLAYIFPTVNTVIVSARNVWPFSNPFGNLKVGSVVESAKIRLVNPRSLVLQLSDTAYGSVSANHTKEGAETINVMEKYKVGSIAKARVLGLDFCSGVAVCTLKKSLVTGINKLDQIRVGDKIRGTVRQFVERGLEVTVGNNLVGFIPTLYLSDVALKHPEKKFFIGDKIDCRVLRVIPEKNRLHLTSKPILVNKDYTVVSTFDEAKVGVITEGVISKIVPAGLLISLFGDLRGFAPCHLLSTETIKFPEKLFFVGQTVKCQITESDKETNRISLSLILKDFNPLGAKQKKIGRNLSLGSFYKGKVTEVTEKGIDVSVTVNEGKEEEALSVPCTIPVHHLSDNLDIAPLILNTYKVGDMIEGLCFMHDVVTILTKKQAIISAVKAGMLPDSYESVEIDQMIPGVVESIQSYGVFLKLPVWNFERSILVAKKNIGDFFVEDISQVLQIGQTMMVKVTQKIDDGSKLGGSVNIKDLNRSFTESADIVQRVLDDFALIRKRSDKKLSKISIGEVLTGTVKQITELGAVLDVKGFVALEPGSSNPNVVTSQPGSSIPVMVLSVDYQLKVLEVTSNPEIISKSSAIKEKPQVDTRVTGPVVLTRTQYNLRIMTVTKPEEYAGCLVFLSTLSHLNQLTDSGSTNSNPTYITATIQSITEKGELIGVDEHHKKHSKKKKAKRERSASVSAGKPEKSKKPRKESECVSISEEMPDIVDINAELNAAEEECNDKPTTPKSPATKRSHSESSAQEESGDASGPSPAKKKRDKKKKNKKKLDQDATDDNGTGIKKTNSPAEITDADNEETSETKACLPDPGWDFSLTSVKLPSWGQVSIWGEDEEEEEETENTTKKHLGKKEAKAMRLKEEADAEQQEKKVLDGESLPPQSVPEFEKLVMSSPDSSLVWIQFMAFHLQVCQYDQARAVAKRAVDRINFREEGERLNVFLAWLNLENSFGTQESLDQVLKDALQRNDEFKVYTQMADIYTKSGKIDEAEKIFKVIVKKFSKVKEVWIRFGLFYYKNTKLEDGRFVFKRCLQNLDAKDAVDTSAKFAQIEFRYGDPERGKTMYEKLVLSHPRRTDLWSSYADQLTRSGDFNAARALYTRISTLGLQAKKMKALFGKWLDFEMVHGTEEQQGEVRRAALQYLNAKEATKQEPVEA